jgi:hypothetical protein
LCVECLRQSLRAACVLHACCMRAACVLYACWLAAADPTGSWIGVLQSYNVNR